MTTVTKVSAKTLAVNLSLGLLLGALFMGVLSWSTAQAASSDETKSRQQRR